MNYINSLIKSVVIAFMFLLGTISITANTNSNLDLIKDINQEKIIKEQKCIAEMLWFEARGMPLQGKIDVLSVAYNRTKHKKFPSTYCKVIEQPWQYSYKQLKNLRFNLEGNNLHTTQIKELSYAAAIGEFKPSFSADTVLYHGSAVNPNWNQKQIQKVQKRFGHVYYELKT